MQLSGYAVIVLVITGYAIILLCADSALELGFFSAGRERRLWWTARDEVDLLQYRTTKKWNLLVLYNKKGLSEREKRRENILRKYITAPDDVNCACVLY